MQAWSLWILIKTSNAQSYVMAGRIMIDQDYSLHFEMTIFKTLMSTPREISDLQGIFLFVLIYLKYLNNFSVGH